MRKCDQFWTEGNILNSITAEPTGDEELPISFPLLCEIEREHANQFLNWFACNKFATRPMKLVDWKLLSFKEKKLQ